MAVARKLKIARVVFPAGAGVMSAFGLLVSPLAFELARSEPCLVAALDGDSFAARFRTMEQEASELLRDAAVAAADIRLLRRLDMRFQGQGYEVEVALPDGAMAEVFDRLPELFRETYAATFSSSTLDGPLEIVTWKVEAVGPEVSLADGFTLEGAGDLGEARKGSRQAYFADAYHDCPVYDRSALAPGMEIAGPALIEERESTCVIGPGERARVDERRNLVAELGEV